MVTSQCRALSLITIIEQDVVFSANGLRCLALRNGVGPGFTLLVTPADHECHAIGHALSMKEALCASRQMLYLIVRKNEEPNAWKGDLMDNELHGSC